MAAVEHNNAAKVPSECGVEETVDYETDSDEGTSALALRRCVASDDEEEEDETNTAIRDDYYDEDSEHHEGGPPVEEDEDEEEAEEEEEYEDAEDEGILLARKKDTSEDYDNEEGIEDASNHAREGTRKLQDNVATGRSNEVASEEKKDTEPFVVPTAGAFYMHDDRFCYNGLARPRRSAGGRRLWEAKDEKPWVHDRFEELKLHDEGYRVQGVRGRRGRGRQGRVPGRAKDTGHARGGKGNRERSFDDSLQSTQRRPGRGRGIRRAKMDEYEFKESRVMSNNFPPSSTHETTGAISTALSMQNPASSQLITKPQDVTSKKPTISSMLKVSSPPFFPTGAALQNLSGIAPGTSKALEEKSAETDVGRLATNSRSGMEREKTGFGPASAMRPPSNPEFGAGLTHVSNSGNVEVHRSMVRGSSTLQQQLMKTGSGAVSEQRIARTEVTVHMVDQSLPSQASSRGATSATEALRVQPAPTSLSQQAGRGGPLATQSMRLQQPPPQQMQAINQTQLASGQSVQLQALVSPVLYPAKPAAMDGKAAPSLLGSNQGNGTVGRGTQALTMQGGRGSVAYGSSTLTNGLRGVVQFSGQQQAGLGVPTVGVALPGYASQPQFNFPNTSPEVTWIPILAGGGSLGSNYNPPYIAVDGGSSAMYYTQQASQAPAAFPPSLGDLSSSKTAVKTPTRTESDDLGQQRRRYSQMTFGEERR